MPDSSLLLKIPTTQEGTRVTIIDPGHPLTTEYNVGGIILPLSVDPSYYSNCNVIYSINDGINPQYDMNYTLTDYLYTIALTLPPNDSTNQSLITAFKAAIQTMLDNLYARPVFSGYTPLGCFCTNFTSETHNLYGVPVFIVLDPTIFVDSQIRFTFPEYVTPTIDMSKIYMWYIGKRCYPIIYFMKCLIYYWTIC